MINDRNKASISCLPLSALSYGPRLDLSLRVLDRTPVSRPERVKYRRNGVYVVWFRIGKGVLQLNTKT